MAKLGEGSHKNHLSEAKSFAQTDGGGAREGSIESENKVLLFLFFEKFAEFLIRRESKVSPR